ncbi:MAG: glycosyltransferase [Proteobacteria bacterium]|nr:MAG: glycosyltransferase [Pseudomonadota bacterium]
MKKSAALFVYVWPEPRSSAAGIRTHELARILQSEGYEVQAYSGCAANEAMAEWEALGVKCHLAPSNDSAVEGLLAAQDPGLVIYDRFVMEEHFGWRLRARWPGALHLIDTQDIHAIRRARERMLKRGAAPHELKSPSEEDLGEDLLRELASLHRADACLVVSSFEKEWLIGQGYDARRVHHLPFSADPAAGNPSYSERTGFCMLGNFRHAPNLDSVNFLVREIWPALREKIPQAALFLYGAYPPAQVSCLDGKKGIRVPGPVVDHRRALQKHRVLLAPLRFGAGIKGKVLEAWACGTAVAGTPIAFEGLSPEQGVGLGDEFLARAFALHENEEDFISATRQGKSILETSFTGEAVRASLMGFLARAFHERLAFRGQLTGRMLRLQQNNATKYFSLWIEAKNKKGPTG